MIKMPLDFQIRSTFKQLEEIYKEFNQRLGALCFGMLITKGLKDAGYYKQNDWIRPYDHIPDMVKLVEEEYRRGMYLVGQELLIYIDKNGLQEYEKAIKDGINKGAKFYLHSQEYERPNLLQQRQAIAHDIAQFALYGFDYIERWKMYYGLFGEKNKNEDCNKNSSEE